MRSSFTVANNYSLLMPIMIIISRNVLNSEMSWPSSTSLSFRTRVHMVNGITGIVGSREYIFSKNIGILGDVAVWTSRLPQCSIHDYSWWYFQGSKGVAYQ